jgi:hypothetical protein
MGSAARDMFTQPMLSGAPRLMLWRFIGTALGFIKKRDADAGFEVRNPLTGRRCRDIVDPRGLRNICVFDDRGEQTKRRNIKLGQGAPINANCQRPPSARVASARFLIEAAGLVNARANRNRTGGGASLAPLGLCPPADLCFLQSPIS